MLLPVYKPAAVKEPEPDDQVDFEDDLVSDPEDLKLLTFEDVTSSREQSPELTAKRPMSPAFTAKKPVTPSTKKPTSPPTAKQGKVLNDNATLFQNIRHTCKIKIVVEKESVSKARQNMITSKDKFLYEATVHFIKLLPLISWVSTHKCAVLT